MAFTENHARVFWAGLQILTKERYEAVLQVFGNLSEAAAHVDKDMLKSLGCRADTVTRVLRDIDNADPEHEEESMIKEQIRIVALHDNDYPALLRETADAPSFLYVRGETAVFTQPCVAMVGTRRMSEYGKRVTDLFTSAFARAGLVTVSGLARGVDTDVAVETMECGGKTIAVLGQGIGTLSARAGAIASRIAQSGGCVVSEFPPRYAPDIFTFPRRNRIISGIASATVVLEAPDSSGALITARCALDEGREVFAVPGPIFDTNYDGCHALLTAERAHVAWRPDDVLRALNVVAPSADSSSTTYLPHGEDDKAVWATLSSMPQHVDILIEKTRLTPGALSATLTAMEMMGVARNLGMNMWVRA